MPFTKPAAVRPEDDVTAIARIFGTRLVVAGHTWLPGAQLLTWGLMAWVAGRQRPQRTGPERVVVGALTMPVVLGSEWAHNLAHAAVAGWIGRPMDAIRVVWGMPILVYYDVEDQSVSPRQHVARALGGPAVNATLFSAASLLYPRTRPGSVARDLVQAAVHTNAFLCLVGLLPIPGIDGGPILKWSLVERGHTPAAANRIVRRVDGVLGVILAVLGWLALKRRHRLLGGLLLQMAALAWAFALGLIKEQDQVATR